MPEISSGTAASLPRGGIGPGIGRISLPRPLTSFVGRQRELAQARRLLKDSCLVTLTGPGGSGKTRLCIALAGEVASDYPDGVFFVPLAPVRDPGLVPSTIAQSIGLQDARDRPLMEHLISQLRDRQLLIVLDNFEHLLAGAPVVTRLLQEASAVRILVSSRSPLRVATAQLNARARPWIWGRPTAGRAERRRPDHLVLADHPGPLRNTSTRRGRRRKMPGRSSWVRSPIMGFGVPCGSPRDEVGFLRGLHAGGGEFFAGGYNSWHFGSRPGQRVTVRITAPARDTWQLWITGGPAS